MLRQRRLQFGVPKTAGGTEVPELARLALWQIADQIDECDKHIDVLERRILAWHKSDEASCNLATIPGIGPITASAIVPIGSGASKGCSFSILRKKRLAASRSRVAVRRKSTGTPCLSMARYRYRHWPRILM